MEGRELFNQVEVQQLDTDHRISAGKPGLEGAVNITGENLFSSLMGDFFKAASGVIINSGSVTTINFTEAFPAGSTYVLFINEQNGVATQVTNKTVSGFNIEPLSNTTIDYLAFKI